MELPSFLQPKKWYAAAFYAVLGPSRFRFELNTQPYWATRDVAIDRLAAVVPQHGVLGLGESTHRHVLVLYEWDKSRAVWTQVQQKELAS